MVPFHLRSDAPPLARPIVYDHELPAVELPRGEPAAKARLLLAETIANTAWRQRGCLNLIPSEMTPSPLVRMLSLVSDPVGRYAEHREVPGVSSTRRSSTTRARTSSAGPRTGLIAELAAFLGCPQVETQADQWPDGQHDRV